MRIQLHGNFRMACARHSYAPAPRDTRVRKRVGFASFSVDETHTPGQVLVSLLAHGSRYAHDVNCHSHPEDLKMTDWVATLSASHEGNWYTCKQHAMWGTPDSAGRQVQWGDTLWIYQAGRHCGYRARCRIVNRDAYAPTNGRPAPWQDGRDYKWLMDIEVVDEPRHILSVRCPSGRQELTGIPSRRLSYFNRLTDSQATSLSDAWIRHLGI